MDSLLQQLTYLMLLENMIQMECMSMELDFTLSSMTDHQVFMFMEMIALVEVPLELAEELSHL